MFLCCYFHRRLKCLSLPLEGKCLELLLIKGKHLLILRFVGFGLQFVVIVKKFRVWEDLSRTTTKSWSTTLRFATLKNLSFLIVLFLLQDTFSNVEAWNTNLNLLSEFLKCIYWWIDGVFNIISCFYPLRYPFSPICPLGLGWSILFLETYKLLRCLASCLRHSRWWSYRSLGRGGRYFEKWKSGFAIMCKLFN